MVRFEMRLDEETANGIDMWRDQNLPGASRAEAMRTLVRRGMNSGMRFSDGEKTILAFLQQLFVQQKVPDQKLTAVLNGFSTGNHWAVDFEMGSLFSASTTTRDDARFVLDVLQMWDAIEAAWETFTEEERAFVLADSELESKAREAGKAIYSREPHFCGFCRAHEHSLVQIAEFLVNDMGRFPRFQGCDLGQASFETASSHGTRLRHYNHFIRPNLTGRLASPKEVREFTQSTGVPFQYFEIHS